MKTKFPTLIYRSISRNARKANPKSEFQAALKAETGVPAIYRNFIIFRQAENYAVTVRLKLLQ